MRAQGPCLLIATTPRSGSWLLAEGLRSLGVAGRPEEFFRTDIEEISRRRWALAPDAPYTDFLHRAGVEGRSPNGVFAAKVHWFQFTRLLARLRAAEREPSGDVALLERRFGELHVVRLDRTDTLRQAISWYRAIRTDDWWKVAGAQEPAGPASSTGVEYDFEGVKHLYFMLERDKAAWAGWFRDSRVRPLDVTYEQLVADYPGTLGEVVRHLRLPAPSSVPAPTLQRQADEQTEEWVEHFHRSWQSLFASGLPQ